MYALKKPRFLQYDSTLSACQVREEFLQRYHELLQRVSRAAPTDQVANRVSNFIEVFRFEWKKKVLGTRQGQR